MAMAIDDNAADEQSDKSRCQLLIIRYTSSSITPISSSIHSIFVAYFFVKAK